jgi:hypothetical protein
MLEIDLESTTIFGEVIDVVFKKDTFVLDLTKLLGGDVTITDGTASTLTVSTAMVQLKSNGKISLPAVSGSDVKPV